ncbi:MAG: peptide-methionine (S)-S-oxide reductase MsrA [Acidobacteriales bacterium]|nr:peptide-methionine (S)-S-oxide reductase MsrA [Terriglobales bacterium]
MAEQTIIFGGGCFWCIEAVFNRTSGVKSAISGYMGGRNPKPTYNQVCGGDTGHVEVVEVKFDPAEVSLNDLLEVFFTVHDPTTPNRQGNDVGEQYRSVIFYHSEEQRRQAEEKIAELTAAKKFPSAIVTSIEPASEFYPAEDYHQEYFDNNRHQPYCMFVVAPKVEKFEKKFSEKVKAPGGAT